MKLTTKQWYEIAGFSLLTALALWIIYHSKKPTQQTQNPVEAINPPEQTPYNIPSLGYPPVTIPNHSSGCDCGCGAGQTTPTTIQQIVDQTNAAIAQMQAGTIQTIQSLADIGNEVGGVFIHYKAQQ